MHLKSRIIPDYLQVNVQESIAMSLKSETLSRKASRFFCLSGQHKKNHECKNLL